MTNIPAPPPSEKKEQHGWREWLMALSNGMPNPEPPPNLVEALKRHCRNLPEPAIGNPPVGRPCSVAPAIWHAESIGELLAPGIPACSADQSRLAYHGRWILRLSEPQDHRWQALVSVIIPVFNRCDLVCEAIASALAQTHRAVEVIVVDDGSTDDLAGRLSVFGDQIRLLRQPQQGVSVARNRGLSIAQGDYINFLDSDDLLEPGWLEAAVQAFWAIPDADLCYAPPRQQSLGGTTAVRPLYLEPLSGDPDCPSKNLMPVVASRHPFLMLGVIMPRWLVLQVGGFEPALARGEDTRFWFQLGINKAKVIGLSRPWNERRILPAGLSSTAPPEDGPGVGLCNLLNLLQQVEHWPQVARLLATMAAPRAWRALEKTSNPVFKQVGQDLMPVIGELSSISQRSGISHRPVLLAIQQLARVLPHLCRRATTDLPLAGGLAQAADQALTNCPSCDEADREFWLEDDGHTDLAADTMLTLTLMHEKHWWNLDPPPSSFWQDIQRTIRSLDAGRTNDTLPHGVIGRPTSIASLYYHRNAIARLCNAAPNEPNRHRLAYHADWLLSLLRHSNSDNQRKGPLVSIVVPVFNRTDTIAEAVDSCLAQTYLSIEIIVIDDGSSEDIAEALQPFRDRIRLFRLESNRGAGAARNVGIKQARGNLVHFLDADDLLEPDAIARKIAALAAIPDADLVFSGARQTGESEQEEGEILHYLQPPKRPHHCPTEGFLEVLSHHYPFLTSTVLVARWRLSEAGLFDPDLRRGQDEELFLRLALREAKVIGITGLPTLRRISPTSLSASRPGKLEHARYRLRCLIDLLEIQGRDEESFARLMRGHLQAINWPLLVTDRSAASERLRQGFGAALRARADKTAIEASRPSAHLKWSWFQEQLRASIAGSQALTSDPWIRALLVISALGEPGGRS